MGGIGKLMPWTRWMFLVASLALVGIFPFAGFFSKDSIIAATLNLGWYGWVFWVVALIGAFLTGLYTFRLYFLVFPGEPSPFVEEHHHDHHGLEGPWTMLVPVARARPCSRRVGGWIQFSPFWHLVTDWLDPVARTLGVAEPTNTQEWVSIGLALGLGLAGIAVAYVIYGARRRRRAAAARRAARPRAQAVLRRGLRRALLRAGGRARDAAARRASRSPFVLAAGPDLGETTMDAGRVVRRLQTGMLRTYVLFLGMRDGRHGRRLPGGAMSRLLVHDAAHLPADGRCARDLGAAALALCDRRPRDARSLLEVGIWIEQAARFDFGRSGLQFSQRAIVVLATCTSRTTSASTASRSGSSASRSSAWPRRSATASGSDAIAPVRTSG